MEDQGKRSCDLCGKPMRINQVQHADDRIEDIYECTNLECENGPDGLVTIKTIDKKTGKTMGAVKFWKVDSFSEWNKGEPSRGEDNVEFVAQVFMEASNREFGTSYDKYFPGPKDSKSERGFDCEIKSESGGYALKLQVTRALPESAYKDQAQKDFRSLKGKAKDAAEWLWTTIQRKSKTASPEVALVIDGTESAELAFVSDLILKSHYKEQLESQGWHSIWVVGPNLIRHLGGNSLPG